ncbi:uncharacterized protein LOC135842021 [Planococcus citri]|uniref:uncharacterized protein LOC135842021 n=1 Tax=Planococcus citri TaxID=170843 RepID=UPI0031F76E10
MVGRCHRQNTRSAMMSIVFPRSIRGISYLMLSIIILACSSTASQNPADDSDVFRYIVPCGEKIDLMCKEDYDGKRGQNPSVSWYRLSARQLDQLNSTKISDLWEYTVRGTYSTSTLDYNAFHVNSTIDDVSVYDSGWYSCLKESNDGKIQEQIRLWLEVIDCADGKGDEQQKQKIQNNEGAPYFANRKVAKYVTTNGEGEITQIAIGCRFRAYPRPTNITWLINGQPVKNREEDPNTPSHKNNAFGTRSYIEVTNSTQLVVTSYTIHICNANGCIDRTFSILPLTSPEKKDTGLFIIETHENVTVLAGESITLEYEFENRTQPWTATWISHVNGDHPLESKNNTQPFVAAYTVPGTLNKQERIYECHGHVSNSKWLQKHFFHVKIIDNAPAGNTKEPTTQQNTIQKKNHVTCGETASLICDTRTIKSSSRIIWYHLSGERVQELIKTNSLDELSKYVITQDIGEYPTRLQLKYVTLFDQGWYSCVEQGLQTKEAPHLRLLTSRLLEIDNCTKYGNEEQLKNELNKIQNALGLPYLVDKKHEKYIKFTWTAETWHELAIACRFRGYPAPQVTWSENGHEVTTKISYGVNKELIHFDTAHYRNFSANYACVACNSNGCTNKTFEITTKPDKNGTVTIETHDYVNVKAGQSITFECEFSRRGFSEYEWILEWSHNNGTVRQCKSSEDQTNCAINDYVSTYPIQKVTSKDEGTYECRVFNWKWIQKQFYHVKIVNN